jgi:TP901 family phage tail tape measure protein
MAINIGDLLMKLKLDGAEFSNSLKGINNTIKKSEKDWKQSFEAISKVVGGTMLAVGGTITATAALSVKGFASMAHEVELMAQKTGFSAKTLSELKYAADLTGTSIQGLEVGVKRMASVMTDASNGNTTAIASLKNLGLSYQDLQGLKPEDQFKKILVAISEIPDPMKRSAAAVDILGRSGTDLLPILIDGEEGFNKMAYAADKAGVVLNETSMKIGADAQEAFEKLEKSVEGVKNKLALALLPALTPIIDSVTKLVQGITIWVNKNPELAATLIKVGTVLGVVLTVVGTTLLLLPKLAAGWAIVTSSVISNTVAAIANAFAVGGLRAAWITLNIAMGPTGWIIAGIAAAAALVVTIFNALKNKTNDVKDAMSDMDKQSLESSIQAKYTAEAWDKLQQRGYLTKEEFNLLAVSLGKSSNELHKEMAAAGLLKVTMSALGTESNVYIQTLDKAKIQANQIADGFAKIGDAAIAMTDETKKALEDMQSAIQNVNQYHRDQVQKTFDAEIKSIDKIKTAEESRHNDKIGYLDDELKRQLVKIKADSDYATAPLTGKMKANQDQIDIINAKKADKEYLADRKELTDKIAALESIPKPYRTKTNEADLAELKDQLALLDLEKENVGLAKELQTVTDKADEDAKTATKAITDLQTDENTLYKDNIKLIEERMAKRTTAFELEVAQYALAAEAFAAAEHLKDEAFLNTSGFSSDTPPDYFGGYMRAPIMPNITVPLMATGGIISKPTIAMVGESGPEAVIPLDRMGGSSVVNIHFNEAVFMDNEQAIEKLKDKIYMAIKRDNRLNFGSA